MNAMQAFDLSRPNIAAHATGLARAAYEHALTYAGERQSFGNRFTSTKPFNSCWPT